MKCIDIWLKQSTTCPKCRGGIRTELTRLELELLDVRDQSNNVTSAAFAPVGAVRSCVCASNSGAQQQVRTTNSRHGSTTSTTIIATTTRATAAAIATSTNRRVITTSNTVGVSSSDTPTSCPICLERRLASSFYSCSTTTTTTSRTMSATTSRRTNTVASRRNQGNALDSNSGQSSTASLTSAVAQSIDSRCNRNELTANPYNAQVNTTCSNGVSESVMARQKAVEAAMQREAEFRRRQENEPNGSLD
ncbi:unnamed protein product [Trichobilharzia szidati]|nr:unnamed protein product [Trichobilharzia szidati]